MRALVIGATGYIGGAVARALRERGHEVIGTARTAEGAARLEEAGYGVVMADLQDPASLRAGVEKVDGVVLAAMHSGPDMMEVERAAADVLLDALAGSNRPFVLTSGTGVLGASGPWMLAENSAPAPLPFAAPRVETERRVVEAAWRGVRSVVVRPAMVYGRGGSGFGLYTAVARQHSVAPYPGDGTGRWGTVHVDDLASLYTLALERAPAGSILHGVAGESVPLRAIAEAAARGLRLEHGARSWTDAQLQEAFGFLAVLFGADQRFRPSRAIQLLGWQPGGPSALHELEHGSYALQPEVVEVGL